MIDIEKIHHNEISFCELFTNKINAKYGILYYNTLNPLSHESNHAHILDIDNDLESSIQEIVLFYRSRQLVPRIYMSFIEGELGKLQPYLENKGFQLNVEKSEWMVFSGEKVPTLDQVVFRRIMTLSDDIVEIIHMDEAGDWTIDAGLNVIKNAITHDNFHLLGLYHEDKCISMGSIQLMDGASRIDNVKTHKAFQGRHFGTRLMNCLTGYHTVISKNYLYLWATNPIAIRMYQNVGFGKFPLNRPCWSAFLK